MVATSSKKVIFQAPKTLITRADAVAAELAISRSELIRIAVLEKIERHEKEILDAELREGYTANAVYYETAIDRFNPRSR